MDKFKVVAKQTQDKELYKLQETYSKIIEYYCESDIKKPIKELVDHYGSFLPRGIDELYVENWLETILLSDLFSKGREFLEYMEKEYQKTLDSLLEKLGDPEIDKEQALSEYEQRLKEQAKNVDLSWVKEVINNFNRAFALKLEHYYEVSLEISIQGFSENLYNLSNEIERHLGSKCENIQDELYKQIKLAIEKISKQVTDKFELLSTAQTKPNQETEINDISLKRFVEIIKTAGFELIDEFGSWSVKEKKTGKSYNLSLHKDKDGYTLSLEGTKTRFRATDKPVTFDPSPNTKTYLDGENEKIIILAENQIVLTTPNTAKTKYCYHVYKNSEGYKFYKDNKLCQTPEEILKIIEVLQNEAPSYYEKIQRDPKFIRMIESIKGITSKENMKGLNDLAHIAGQPNLDTEKKPLTNEEISEIINYEESSNRGPKR